MKGLELRLYTSKHCGHCIALKKDIAYVLKWCSQKNIYFKNFDADNDKNQYKIDNINAVPTIILLIDNNKYEINKRNGQEIINEIIKYLKKHNLVEGNQIKKEYQNKQISNNTLSNQKQNKIKYELIAYTASWCPHCINLKPTLEKIKVWCKNQNINYINYDADLNKDKMNGIEGFPTVKLFNKINNKSIELHNRNFEGMKQEINDFINSSSMNGGNYYSKEKVFYNQSLYQNGRKVENNGGYIKECDGNKCRIYKLNKPEEKIKDDDNLFDINYNINGFYNAFGGFEPEEYNPNIDYKEKYNKYKYKLLHLEGKI